MAGGVGEKFKREGCVGSAVQRSFDGDTAACRGDRGQHRKILQIIWPGVEVAWIIKETATPANRRIDKFDSQESIGVDGISANFIIYRGILEDTQAKFFIEGYGVT